MKENPQKLKALECPHCGAPIDYILGETLLTCKYCGYTFSMLKEGEYKEIAEGKHFMLTNNYNEEETKERVFEWMRTGLFKAGDLAEKSEIIEMELKFLPIWIVNVKAETAYNGMKKVEEVERRQRPSPDPNKPPVVEEIRRQRLIPKSGRISDIIDWKVLAAKGMKFPVEKVELPATAKIPFNIKNIPPGAELVNGDVHENLAKSKAESAIRNLHREKARREIDVITKINTKVEVGDAELLTVPFWFIQYKYNKKSYLVILNGVDGEVIQGEAPIGKIDIAVITSIGLAIIFLLALEALYKQYVFIPFTVIALLIYIGFVAKLYKKK